MVRTFPSNLPASPCSRPRLRVWTGAAFICALLVLVITEACSPSGSSNDKPSTPSGPANSASTGNAAPDVKALMEKYASLDTSHSSVTKLKASVQPSGGKAEQVQFTMYREREAAGDQHILVEFTSPAEERDRDALINVSAQGEIEAVRYGQGAKSFMTAKSPADEESLFGLTLQELIGGEPEKYDYKFVDEETYQGTGVYRVEGTLKAGAESRFPRLVMLISKQNATASTIEVYDSHNELARRLTVEKTDQISGIWTRTKWTIDNQEQHKEIEFDAADVKYNQSLPDSIFTKDHLKQIASK
jgi:hypothetical protein